MSPEEQLPKRRTFKKLGFNFQMPSETLPQTLFEVTPSGLEDTPDSSQIAESFRLLRTRILQYNFGTRPHSILLTSCQRGEGKSTCAIHLALSMAKHEDKRILLVDGDLRRPSVARYLNVNPPYDLVDYLRGEQSLADVICHSPKDKLYFVSSQKRYPNATELIELPTMPVFLSEAHRYFDFVIIDTCPILAGPDPAILGKMVGGIVMVVQSRVTQTETIQRAISVMNESQTNILGSILTHVKDYLPRYFSHYHYYQSYYYHYGE